MMSAGRGWSYGGGESGTTSVEAAYNHAGIAITASSGDACTPRRAGTARTGYDGPTGFGTPNDTAAS